MKNVINRNDRILLISILLLVPLVFSAVWCSIAYNVAPQPTIKPTLRVMTYNIHEGVTVDNKLDLNAISDTIKQWDPDILVLQEVDTGVILTGSVDQARWLAMRLNMNFVTDPSHDHMWQGNAILSKYPIAAWDSIRLVSPNEVDTCLNATLDVNGQQLTVFVVHLTVMGPVDRRIQAETALPYIDSTPGLKIFMGDFNIDAYTTNATDSSTLAYILTSFDDTFDQVPTASRFGNLTSPSWAPEERIDYIFVSPEITILQHGTLSSLASDHLPVVAELQLPS